MNKFAETLKELMDEQGLNQLALADLLGIRQSQISNWLNGRSLPNYTSLQLIKDAFSVSIDDFFT